MLRVVIDTNVYISAIIFDAKPEQVVRLALEGFFKLYVSPEITAELSSVLLKKFQYPQAKVNQIIHSLERAAIIVNPTKTITRIKGWPADNRILECCEEAKADYLISGDKKHLLPLKKYKTTSIVTPAKFLEIFFE